MSLITKILDRLSSIAIVREKLAETAQKADRLADAALDHERRLVRVETTVFPAPAAPRKRLPRKPG